MWKWLRNWAVGGSWKNFEEQGRKSLECFAHTVGRNMDINHFAIENSKGSKEHVILENTYIFMNRFLVEMCSVKEAAGKGSE